MTPSLRQRFQQRRPSPFNGWPAITLLLGLAIASLSGCSEGQSASVPSADPSAANRSPFEPQLLAIAAEYLDYSLVDPAANWAPQFCAPTPPPPAILASASDDPASHGSKLYYLFAKKHEDYLYAAKEPSPVGQAVVKESWTSTPAAGPTKPHFAIHASGQEVTPYATKGEQYFHAGEKSALFVMFKTNPDTPGTDAGWVYGTLTPDGSRVLSAGMLANCMACHTDGPKDRLFGPKNPPPFPR